MTAPRYVVIGAGAVGALLAAQMQLAGVDTTLVARGASYRAIAKDGLRIRRPTGVDDVAVTVIDGPEAITLTHRDVLVLATKAQDAEAALVRWAWRPVLDAEGAPTLLGADLPVLTLQNGLVAEELAARRFRRVVGVTVGIAASHLVPGEVVSPSVAPVGLLWLGLPSAGSDAATARDVHRWAADLTRAGYGVEVVDDIGAYKARKLLLNLRNGLDVLTGEPGERDRVLRVLEDEALAVYRNAGMRVVEGPLPTRHRLVVEAVPGHVPGRLSTWQSFARGASSEIDHLNGEIVLLGRRHGVATPVNERLQRLLGALAETGAGPGSAAIGDLGVAA